MSLLEDIFLQDEAGEAQELERIIEADDYDERPRELSNSEDNSEKEDEAEEDKRRVDPASTKTKRVIKNPRFVLNPARLTGPRGIQVIPEHFKDFKFKGKGHEKEDLDLVLKKLEHWAYRLYPKFDFADCLKKIETLGKKRPVQVHLTKIRSDQLVTEDAIVQRDSSDDELPQPPQEEDEFDKLLAQQIELARNTPAPGSVKKAGLQTPAVDNRTPLLMPKATSSPSISDEQKERMIRNRKLAEERRLARLKAATANDSIDLTNSNIRSGKAVESTIDLTETIRNEINGNVSSVRDSITITGEDENSVTQERKSKKNRSNVIDSSDEDDNISADSSKRTDTVSVDIHKSNDIVLSVEGSVTKTGEGNENSDTQENKSKKNRSNVIDSSDEDDNIAADTSSRRRGNVSVDVPESNEVIDITGGYEIRAQVIENDEVIDLANVEYNKMTDKHKEMKNMSNIISSSEDEVEDNIATEREPPTNTQNVENIINIIEGYPKSNIMDSEEVDIVDIKNNTRRPNLIDSSDSDEDCGMTTVNESISVDVHREASQSTNEKLQKDKITHSLVENIIKTPDIDTQKANEIMVEKTNTDTPVKSTELQRNEDNGNTLKDEVNDVTKKDQNQEKEKIEDEDLMDLDFNDDF